MKDQTPSTGDTSSTSLSVLVLISHWPLSEKYQQQLLTFARAEEVQELILIGKGMQELPFLLTREPKLRLYRLSSGSVSFMAEAGAFEADADVLVILKQGVSLPGKTLRAIMKVIAAGCHFGGLIGRRNRCWLGLLKKAARSYKGLYWFRLCQGYFVSRKTYHHSGGFKHNGKWISFFELLARQQKISPHTFLFFLRNA